MKTAVSNNNYGRRMTRQRRVILEELRKVSSHPTADQVYDLVRKKLPGVSLGTVYRNLDTLSEEGEIRKIILAGTRQRFDGMADQHYHLRCLVCGRLEDLKMEPLRHLEQEAIRASGYRVTGHCLEFHGICPACRARLKMEKAKQKAKQKAQ
jgi:Fur family ferric uptake transcriptional regulator